MSYAKETPLGLDSSAKEVSLEINESKTKIRTNIPLKWNLTLGVCRLEDFYPFIYLRIIVSKSVGEQDEIQQRVLESVTQYQ